LKRQFRSKNQLSRRVQRHAEFTTLFQTHAPGAKAELSGSLPRPYMPSRPLAQAPDGLPIVMGSWEQPNTTSREVAAFPSEQSQFAQAERIDSAAPITDANAPVDLASDEPTSGNASLERVQLKPEAGTRPSQQRAALTESSRSESSRSSGSQTNQMQSMVPSTPQVATDSNWSRLQAIMRHHDAKEESNSAVEELAVIDSNREAVQPIQSQSDSRAARLDRLQGISSEQNLPEHSKSPSLTARQSAQPVVQSNQNIQAKATENLSRNLQNVQTNEQNPLVEPLHPLQLQPDTALQDTVESGRVESDAIEPETVESDRRQADGFTSQPIDPTEVNFMGESSNQPSNSVQPTTAEQSVQRTSIDGAAQKYSPQTQRELGSMDQDSTTDKRAPADTNLLDTGVLDTGTSTTIEHAEGQPNRETVSPNSTERVDIDNTESQSIQRIEETEEMFESVPDLVETSNNTLSDSVPAQNAEPIVGSEPIVEAEKVAVPRTESGPQDVYEETPNAESNDETHDDDDSYAAGSSLAQSGWVIQRTESETSRLDNSPNASAPLAPILSNSETTEVQIQQAINDIPAARATDSTVELVVPRRSRESILSAMHPNRIVTSDESVSNAQSDVAAKTSLKEPTSLQRKPSDTPLYSVLETQPEMIETEIGSLPSDLWEHIEHVPPSANVQREIVQKSESDSSIEVLPTAGQMLDAQASPVQKKTELESGQAPREISVLDTPEVVGHDKSVQNQVTEARNTGITSSNTHLVQRLPEEHAVTLDSDIEDSGLEAELDAALPPATDVSEEAESDGQSHPPEIDTDEIARQVYTQLKRRLAVEQERIGRR